MSMYLPQPREEISQGDVFQNVSLVAVTESADNPGVITHLREGYAILLTHDCEYDKPANRWVLVAEVRPLAEIPSGSQGHIRQYRTRNTFYLESLEPNLPESYVDFRRLSPLPKSALSSPLRAGNRLVSLNDEARLALQRQIAIFFGYGR
jgi:hypothetical protein